MYGVLTWDGGCGSADGVGRGPGQGPRGCGLAGPPAFRASGGLNKGLEGEWRPRACLSDTHGAQPRGRAFSRHEQEGGGLGLRERLAFRALACKDPASTTAFWA